MSSIANPLEALIMQVWTSGGFVIHFGRTPLAARELGFEGLANLVRHSLIASGNLKNPHGCQENHFPQLEEDSY